MAVIAREPRPVGVLKDGTVFYAPLGVVVDDGQGRVCCHLCGRWLQVVGGTHLRVGHGWTLAQYREAFQLLKRSATCSPQLSASYRGYAHARQGHRGFGTTLSGGGSVRPVPGWRSLERVRPDLARELHPARNAGLDPAEIAVSSHRRVWWRCASCAHEWQATPTNREGNASGCPQCALRARVQARSRVDPQRSLALVHPELATELDPDRNPGLDPMTLGARSGRRVWWRCCDCGRSWQARVANRARGTGCPACREARRSEVQSIVARDRSITVRAPWLLAELDPDRNPELDPSALGASSGRRVWWRCRDCGHSWQARVADRTAGTGCPACARHRRTKTTPSARA